MYVSFIALCESIISQHLFWSDFLTFSFQVGDAGDPELHDALTIIPGGMEESDWHVHNTALPQYGKQPVLHSSENYQQLMHEM